jgi:hypothetical protein
MSGEDRLSRMTTDIGDPGAVGSSAVVFFCCCKEWCPLYAVLAPREQTRKSRPTGPGFGDTWHAGARNRNDSGTEHPSCFTDTAQELQSLNTALISAIIVHLIRCSAEQVLVCLAVAVSATLRPAPLLLHLGTFPTPVKLQMI